jgi:hypothetical protein
MIIPFQSITEAIFLASIFLLAISLPKLVIFTIWSSLKLWLFKNISQTVKSRFINTWIRGDFYEKMLEESEKPIAPVKYMLSAYTDYLGIVREPLVESIVGWILLVWVSFPDFPIFLLIALVAIIVIIGCILVNLVRVLREMDKLKQAHNG